MYGSVPRNESNCVVEGRQIALQFIVYNPHDSFTNFTVRWFRNADLTRAAASTEEITGIENEYYFFYEFASMTNLAFQNCTTSPLYRDIFALIINNFTSDKNGYYWCQIYVDNSVSQPMKYAWFYAVDSSSCLQNRYFLIATISQAECAILIYSNSSVISPTDRVTTSILETTSESGIITYCIAGNFQLITSIIILLAINSLAIHIYILLYKPLLLLYIIQEHQDLQYILQHRENSQ